MGMNIHAPASAARIACSGSGWRICCFFSLFVFSANFRPSPTWDLTAPHPYVASVRDVRPRLKLFTHPATLCCRSSLVSQSPLYRVAICKKQQRGKHVRLTSAPPPPAHHASSPNTATHRSLHVPQCCSHQEWARPGSEDRRGFPHLVYICE